MMLMVIGQWAEKKCETTQLALAQSSLKNWVASVDVGSTYLRYRITAKSTDRLMPDSSLECLAMFRTSAQQLIDFHEQGPKQIPIVHLLHKVHRLGVLPFRATKGRVQ
ncbi:hypothetical protein F5Y13DRAFT_174841 [Hypoxylon sp. FL1857]|nr:hypothetical protein F5Y13DRAFT_174841 [Hypoxylon sp. FL1857]